MSAKATWFWIALAGILGVLIVVHEYLRPAAPPAAPKVLPALKAADVTAVQIRPPGPAQLDIRAERTNGTWRLTAPLVYAAQSAAIEELLIYLEALAPAAHISAAELRSRPRAIEEYGFALPQACSIILQQRDYRIHLLLGARTAPGDQVFLQVVNSEGAYVVDAELLRLVPQSANDWRDTALVDVDWSALDRLAVTNPPKAFVLERASTNSLWRMMWPLDQARADNARIQDSLQKLEALRIRQFVTDDPTADLESFGLAPPELEVALGQGTNPPVVLQFGRAATNDSAQVYARRAGQNTVVTVAKDLQEAWRGPSVNDFRDPHLLTLTEPVQVIQVSGPDAFLLERQGNGSWRIQPEGLLADTGLVYELVAVLSQMQIVEFTKDVVNPPELPRWGLAPPAREFVLKSASTNNTVVTNAILADLSFGTNQADRVYARRSDETAVYAVKIEDVQRLPTVGWHMRERRFWDFTENDINRLTLQQEGRTRQLIREGPHEWSLAPGSQGEINELAIEETVRGLARASAAAWIGRGEPERAQYGLTDKNLRVTFELKNGNQAAIQFGGEAEHCGYAGVTLDGQLWIMELPWKLYRDAFSYLAVP